MADFDKYFSSLQGHSVADITEHSHRSSLQQLLEGIASKGIKILHEPKREGKFGSPDFKITAAEAIIGYVENKKIQENLNETVKSAQIKKYTGLSDNILITNYIEWIWLKEGKEVKREKLCTIADIENKRATLETDRVSAVVSLIKNFLSQPPKQIADAKKLASVLAIRAKLLKDFLQEELERQVKEHQEGRLYQLYETFKQFVFNELKVTEFADAFAQNLVYGLFLAKLNADTKTVTLYNAKQFIPGSFELIRELVNFLDELDEPEYTETKWIVEEVLSIMNHLDLPALHTTLSFKSRKKDDDGLLIKDPYVYFYEDFLAAYDKKLRESKGVYYTPPPVVNFIVRAIDDILINTFGIQDGLADRKRVTVLDFATGTGTFLVEILQQIFDKIPPNAHAKKQALVKEHVLKNIFGFEYLIAPYTIAHLKLSQFLKDNGYTPEGKERMQVYLTNTLEPVDKQVKIPLLPALSQESRDAQKVKDTPILVITGNPPYRAKSKNNGPWIKEKVKEYYFIDGIKLKESNPKALQDDYVKFIRFAQDKMDAVEEGVIGIITNHTFLFNPTCNGMRKSLMDTFNQIYLINLHGNVKMREKTPEGGKDENVFDIEQGVSISIFVKKKNAEPKIYYTDFYGLRKNKYVKSLHESIDTIEWNELKPEKPLYLFQPLTSTFKNEYNNYWGLLQIFKLSSSGVKTHRDHFAYDFEEKSLKQRIEHFANQKVSDNEIKLKYKLEHSDSFSLNKSREKVRETIKNLEQYKLCLYRPFDNRFLFYNDAIIDRSRKEIMANLQQQNIALISGRAGQVIGDEQWSLISVTDKITDVNLFYRGGAVLFPLYTIKNGDNLISGNSYEKSENFSKTFRDFIDGTYNSCNPETIFNYIYSILHSPTYRTKYAEFLKIDFPRIPFTEDKKLFEKLAALGADLIQAHLQEDKFMQKLPNPKADLLGEGDPIVQKVSYVSESKQLWINERQHFCNILPEVYDFYIGGYKVLDKYLKDRKGRELGMDELDHVGNIVKSITFTIRQMQEIDKYTKEWI